MNKRKVFMPIMIVMMSITLIACGGSDESSATSSDDGTTKHPQETAGTVTLTESWSFPSGIVPALNPGVATNYEGVYWGKNFYDTLVSYDDQRRIVGQLAESWEMSDDGKRYTFHLRDGVRFSDGTPLTAEAVKLSFEAAVFNLGMFNGSYGRLSSLFETIEIIDDLTVAINLTQPYYGTLNDLTMSCPLAIVNPVAFEGADDLRYSDVFKTASFGTGPYMYQGEYSNNTYTFVRNPHYWGEPPHADKFEVKIIADNDTKLLALRNGEIDMIAGTSRINFDGFAQMSAVPGFGSAMDSRSSLNRFLGMNLTKAPFNDERVRKAVAYAIDQQALEKAVFNGLETATETLFPATATYCDVDQTVFGTDLEQAGRLMAAAGWVDTDGDGIREKDTVKLVVDMNYLKSLASIDNLALALASQLKKIGFKVNVIPGDMMTYYAAMATSHLVLANTYGGAFDPNAVLTNMNPSFSTDPLLIQVSGFFSEGLLDELEATSDENRVKEIYEVILKTIADKTLLVPLTRSHDLAIWNDTVVDGYVFDADPSYVLVQNIRMK